MRLVCVVVEGEAEELVEQLLRLLLPEERREKPEEKKSVRKRVRGRYSKVSEKTLSRVYSALGSNWKTARELKEELSLDNALIYAALEELIELGMVEVEGRGVRNNPKRYRRVQHYGEDPAEQRKLINDLLG